MEKPLYSSAHTPLLESFNNQHAANRLFPKFIQITLQNVQDIHRGDRPQFQ